MSLDFGYLDPGTGSVVIQAIIGVVAGALFAFRNFISRAVLKLKTLTTKRNSSTSEKEVAQD
ncbi:MAG: hypothetical protein A3E94_02960 [Candidatus Zambryskibacteria bacterium RIFCSPHIGHO2_12_FULL_44_12b]|nr:MAG: hypothetical protein A3E94_02960 [Candidatus Zambryskibacteria bacterium RIFCSPHIGHO2_12_FULL_44_12b]